MKSNIIQEILDRITPEEHVEFERQIEEDIAFHEQLKKDGRIYATNTSITLDIVRAEGFNPIGICDYAGEECLLFSSQKEANVAYKKLEKEQKRVYAWWYSKKQFEKEVEESKGFYQPSKIYWLNE